MHYRFELQELHELLLVAIFLGEDVTRGELGYAVELHRLGGYDYGKLLKQAVKRDERALERPYFDDDVERALSTLDDIGLIRKSGLISGDLSKKIVRITPEGMRVATAIVEGRQVLLRPKSENRTSAFVASAFGKDELNALYHSELVPAIEASGLQPFRVDLSEPHQTITERILNGILECKVLVADLTFARPSVYFEVGLAHGLGIPMMLTCRRDHFRGGADSEKVHFDLEQYKISYWETTNGKDFSWPGTMSPKERLPKILTGSHR